MDLNEQIHLENYNPKWQEFFAAEQARLEELLINHPKRVYLEHIGSTAIPNMTAKPIIDILVGVETFPPDSLFIKKIESLGYEFMASGSVAERLYFVKRSKIFYNIQVVKYNDPVWVRNILFRNFLTTHPEKAKAYADLKRKIYESGVTTLLEYSAQKADFIVQIIEHF